MKAHFSRAYTISASHRLHTDALSDEENRTTFGKCNNPYGHGHNYRIEVTVAGPIHPDTGMVLNMSDLDAVVQREILDRYDLRDLNGDPLFQDRVSTTENLCIAIYDQLEAALRPAHLERIRVEETENNFFEYSGALGRTTAQSPQKGQS